MFNDISKVMEMIEDITQKMGTKLEKDNYYIEDMGCPHNQPKLPKDYAAIYIFIYKNNNGVCEYLKIGKANPKSNARFTSQHYGFSAKSTLAKSICADNEFISMGIDKDNVKQWMLNNLQRINIYVKADCGKATTELIESVLHYAFRPRYEGSIHNYKS